MSFFLKSKQRNVTNKFTADKRRKRKAEPISTRKDDEITSSEDEEFHTSGNHLSHQSSDDENETVQEKKLRLAKVYLEEIEKEEKQRLEDQEVTKEVLSKRLKVDHLKQIGKYETTIADRYMDAGEGEIIVLKCREQRNTVTCLCISADDNWVFSGSKDGVIVKWSIRERKKLGIIPFVKSNVDRILGHTSCIYSVAISTDNKFLVVGDSSGSVQIWDPETLKHIGTLNGHKKPVTGLCFKLNSHTLFSSSNDRSVRVWSLDEMAFVETLFGHQDGITAIDVLQSDKPVTAGGRDGTLRVWKVAEESQLIFNAQSGNIDAVRLINEQNFIAGDDSGQVSIWSSIKKKPLSSVKEAHGCEPGSAQPNWISAVAALPHSDLAASGSRDGFIRVWKLADRYRTPLQILQIPSLGFVNALGFTSDGKYLIAGCGKDHRLGRWSTVKEATNCLRLVELKQKI